MREKIEVFKAGKHRAMDGREYEFSEADVAAIAAAYDPALAPAPHVLGHPKADAPAWGWAKGLIAEGGTLFAESEQVDEDFAAGVEAGRYRNRSASFYAPNDARNPKPGSWYLRHIGWLGAQAPAVKGLAPAFSEEHTEAVDFAAAEAWSVKALFRGLRDFMIEKFSLEEADRVLPSWTVDNIEPMEAPAAFAEGEATEPGAAGESTTAAADEPAPPLGEPGPDIIDPAAARAAELDAREADLAKRERDLATREQADREAAFAEDRAEDATFLDGLVAEGRLPPIHRDRVAGIFARLGGDSSVSFSEPNADPRAELRDLLSGLGVSINFGESAAGDGFNPHGSEAAPEIARRIRETIAAAKARGETLSASQAAALIGR